MIEHQELEAYLESARDDDSRIRASAIIALGKSGKREAIDTLAQILENRDELDWIRGCAAIALGRISGEEVIPLLIKSFSDDSPAVARAAVSASGEVKSEQVIIPLQEMLADQSKNELHALIVSVLGKVGGSGVTAILLQELENPNDRVRRSAALALSDLRVAEAVRPFIKLLNDEDECLRSIAASALGLIRDKQASEGLITALGDSAETVRAIAASSLGYLGETRAIQALEKALEDESVIVRKQARVGLGKLGVKLE